MKIPFSFNPIGISSSTPPEPIRGMYLDNGVLKGVLFTLADATSADPQADGSALVDGSYMFADTAMSSWSVDIPNLSDGVDMFSNCELDETSTLNILTSIPTYTSGSHNINIGKNTNWYYNQDVIDLLGSTTAGDKSYNGWTVTVEQGNPPVDGMYIDANGELCGRFFNLREYRAIQGIAADADFSTLTDGTRFFEESGGVTSFSGDLSNLEYGDRMFYDAGLGRFSSFSAGTDGLKSLQSGEDMFDGCRLDATSALHIVNTIPTYESGTHLLHLGTNSNFKSSQELATLLGTTRPIQNGTYSCKGWTITIGY